MVKQFIKKRVNKVTYIPNTTEINNKDNNEKNMINKETIDSITTMVDNINPKTEVKRVKKEKGLMEKNTTDKVVIIEDNRQVLKD